VRIVAVADTHLFHDELLVPEGDVFVHAGDMCRGGSFAELALAAQWIRSLPHRTKVVVAGNHDWAFARSETARRARDLLGPDVTYLQDDEATIDGVRFYGSPWQPEFNDWAFNLPRGRALADVWARIPRGVDVLITHGPPVGIGDHTMFGKGEGCSDLRARVEIVRPKLHLFGHIHESGGAWTIDGVTFVNCTTWECERAPTVLDVGAAGVTCVSVPPTRAPR